MGLDAAAGAGKVTQSDLAAWGTIGAGGFVFAAAALGLLLLRRRRRAGAATAMGGTAAAASAAAAAAAAGGGGSAAAPQLRRPPVGGAGAADQAWELENPLAVQHAAVGVRPEERRAAFQALPASPQKGGGGSHAAAAKGPLPPPHLLAMAARLIKAHELPPGFDFVEHEKGVAFVDHEGLPCKDPRLDAAAFAGALLAAQLRGVDLEKWLASLD